MDVQKTEGSLRWEERSGQEYEQKELEALANGDQYLGRNIIDVYLQVAMCIIFTTESLSHGYNVRNLN